MDKTSILPNLIYGQSRFGYFGFGSVKPTEISVSVVSVFTRFGHTLAIYRYKLYAARLS